MRYIFADRLVEKIGSSDLCITSDGDYICYDWSSNAYLKSETKYISKAYKNFYFFLNHCDRSSCFYPKSLEIKAKVAQELAIINPRQKEHVHIDVVTSKNDIVKISNSRSIVKRSSIGSIKLDKKPEENYDLFVEKFKEIHFYYMNEDGVQISIKGEESTYNFGTFLLDCQESEC